MYLYFLLQSSSRAIKIWQGCFHGQALNPQVSAHILQFHMIEGLSGHAQVPYAVALALLVSLLLMVA